MDDFVIALFEVTNS